MTTAPNYWMWETSGVLRPAVEAYLAGGALSDEHVAALRAYLRQWIAAPLWRGDGIASLRAAVDALDSRETIHAWLTAAMDAGVDPL